MNSAQGSVLSVIDLVSKIFLHYNIPADTSRTHVELRPEYSHEPDRLFSGSSSLPVSLLVTLVVLSTDMISGFTLSSVLRLWSLLALSEK